MIKGMTYRRGTVTEGRVEYTHELGTLVYFYYERGTEWVFWAKKRNSQLTTRYEGTTESELQALLDRLARNAKLAARARAKHAAYTSLGMKRTPYGYE